MNCQTFFKVILVSFFSISFQLSSQKINQIEKQSLNGEWAIIFDEKNVGATEKWFLKNIFDNQENKTRIQIPNHWETLKKDYEGVVFYKKMFQVPKSWEKGIVTLHFEAVNYKTEVWVNDQAVGIHEGGFTPFSFQVNQVLKAGELNSLIIRVVGPILMTDQRIDEMGRMEVPQWRGAITGGIWQDVWIQRRGNTTIQDVFIQPNIDKSSITLDLKLFNHKYEKQTNNVSINVNDKDGNSIISTSLEYDLSPGNNNLKTNLKIPNQVFWSPTNPYLYSIDIIIQSKNNISDKWSHKFGMRKFTIENNQFYLNNKPFYLKATFFEGLYPVGLAYPDSKEMVKKEIQLAKDAGFNMIRPWRKPASKMWLDLADELGILTVGSLAIECMNRPIQSAYLPMRVENELTKTILKDRNRTSIVMWELFNELIQPVMIQMLRPMSIKARELDPTRLILDESGGWAKGARMYLPYEKTGNLFNDIHDYSGSQITQSIYDGYANIGYTVEELNEKGLAGIKIPGKNVVPGQLSFVSELGYGSLPNLPKNNLEFKEKGNPLTPPMRYHLRLENELGQMLKKTGFDVLFKSFEDFCLAQQSAHGKANKRLLEATRSNPNIIGYCVHALTSGDWIIGAGLLDLWRNPKTDVYELTKEANQEQIITLRVIPRNNYKNTKPKIEIVGVNESQKIKSKIHLKIFDSSGNIIFKKEVIKPLSHGITNYLSEEIDMLGLEGSFKADVKLNDFKGNLIAKNSFDFDIFKPEDFNNYSPIQLIDFQGDLRNFLIQKKIPFVDFSSGINEQGLILAGVSPKNKKRNNFISLIKEAKNKVIKGSNLIVLDVPGNVPPYFGRKFEYNTVEGLPFSANMLNKGTTLGLWAGKPHMIKKHPIFKGLPTGIIMQEVYQNVHPKTTMMMQEGDIISGVVSYDHFQNLDLMLRHYPGPGDVWFGANILETKHGKGTMLFSTFDIINNLNSDPVAEIILKNMINYINIK